MFFFTSMQDGATKVDIVRLSDVISWYVYIALLDCISHLLYAKIHYTSLPIASS